MIGRVVPGVAALRSYQRGWFTPDLLAGVTVWAILVPQAMGYASSVRRTSDQDSSVASR
ncbi:MAG: hypothetical protein ACC726_04240 [Chloroflexota bacterium]